MGEDDSGVPDDGIKNLGWGYLRFGDLVIEPEDPDEDGLLVYIDYKPSFLGEDVRVKLSNDELHELYYQLGMFLTNWNRIRNGTEPLPFFKNGAQENGSHPE